MRSLGASIKRVIFTFISLSNTQNFFSRFLKASQFLPEISIPRFAFGAEIPEARALEIYHAIPSLASKAWTEYWIQIGKAFEGEKNYRAACMSYIMGAFPKENHSWKDRCNELRKSSFKKWCLEHRFDFEERILQQSYGPIRYYLFVPQSKTKSPATLFVNGLEGSAEEIAFPLLKFKEQGDAFALTSVPGGVDSPIPMSTDSEKLLSAIYDDMAAHPSIDSERMGIVGFSFGAYWSFILAKSDPRVKYAVVNGMPYRHTFNPDTSFGINPVISYGLMCVFAVKHPLFLVRIMRELIRKADRLLPMKSGPILAIDGDKDTIVDPRDTEVVGTAPGNRLLFIKNDDHCGLFHYDRMIQIIFLWIRKHLDASRQ